MLKTDYHLHTNYSPDSFSPMENIVKACIDKGLKEIALTDHMEFCQNWIPTDYNIYQIEFNRLKSKYEKDINLILGVEIGLGVSMQKEIKQFISQNNFDFVIGSLHDIEGVEFHTGDFFRNKTKDQAYNEYFSYILECVKCIDCFNVLGHIDYIYRYANYKDNSLDYQKHKTVIDEILKHLIKEEKGLELNTSSYKTTDSPHPSLEILKGFKDLGGKILTIGSDAHSPKWVAYDFEFALRDLKSINYDEYAKFRNMQPFFDTF